MHVTLWLSEWCTAHKLKPSGTLESIAKRYDISGTHSLFWNTHFDSQCDKLKSYVDGYLRIRWVERAPLVSCSHRL